MGGGEKQHKLKSFVDAMMIIRLWSVGGSAAPLSRAGLKRSPGPSHRAQCCGEIKMSECVCVCVWVGCVCVM